MCSRKEERILIYNLKNLGLEKIKNAPSTGYILAYCKKGVLFRIYDDTVNNFREPQDWEDGELLELHIFNEKKEYRAVFSEERQKYIEAIIQEQNDEGVEFVKVENMFLKNSSKKLKVVNYITYDENDMIVINNYRLAGVISDLSERRM